MTNHPFFVYGTLRPGQGNYRLLAGRTVGEFPAVLD
ncbi:MAG: gamma-glutamylcyclotransferase, partial [Actinobacteria bacterium]|nr:gamma-glutamylcyclotransferase [Actinomycetota bacterium]